VLSPVTLRSTFCGQYGRIGRLEPRKLQAPPLRYAPVGMTRLVLRFLGDSSCRENATILNLVIPTGASRISYYAAPNRATCAPFR
jgi:hypothetical protein